MRTAVLTVTVLSVCYGYALVKSSNSCYLPLTEDLNNKKGLIMTMLIFLAFISLTLLWVISQYNRLIRLKTLLNEAFSGIDVQYKKRSDLISNLVAVVKQYGIHEKEILENVAKMRSVSLSSSTPDQKSQAESGVTTALKTLFAVVENYPNLKANENFLSLQEELSGIEEELALARRYYNGTARNYNMKIGVFPTNIFANYFNFTPASYFELTTEQDKQTPKISF